MDQVEESLDFDFFETPRNQSNRDSDNEIKKSADKPQNSRQEEQISNSDIGKNKNKNSSSERGRRSSSLSVSSDEGDADYSSDSVSSLSDSQDVKHQSKKSPAKDSYRDTSSDSSVSNSSRNKSKDVKESPRSNRRKQNDSRSDDNSSDISVSGSSNHSGGKLKKRKEYNGNRRTVMKGNKEVPKREHSKDEEVDYSSSAYSDGEETSNAMSVGNDKRSKPVGNGSKRQEAWGIDDRQGSKSKGNVKSKRMSKERPKTAKNRKENGSQRSHSPQSQSDSEALSDSDITDVSPMDSPRSQDKSKLSRSHNNLSHIGAAGDGTNVKPQFRTLPLNEEGLENEDDLEESEMKSAGIDLKMLMKAVGELEKKKRVEANSRRVMFAPMTLKRNEKSNYTFSSDKTHDIDRENDRLLKEIVKQVHADNKKQYFRSPTAPKSKITPSAINREKEMKRIEADNLNFLKRLQKVKATSTISRNNQLKEYENTKLHGIPIATLHPVKRASSRSSQLTDSFSSIGSRTRSLTSLHSVASTVRSTSSKRSSRPGSATKRIDHRPDWNDRW